MQRHSLSAWLLPSLAIVGPALGLRIGMWCRPDAPATGGAMGFAAAALVLYAIVILRDLRGGRV
jgi:hypothetical protein